MRQIIPKQHTQFISNRIDMCNPLFKFLVRCSPDNLNLFTSDMTFLFNLIGNYSFWLDNQ